MDVVFDLYDSSQSDKDLVLRFLAPKNPWMAMTFLTPKFGEKVWASSHISQASEASAHMWHVSEAQWIMNYRATICFKCWEYRIRDIVI